MPAMCKPFGVSATNSWGRPEIWYRRIRWQLFLSYLAIIVLTAAVLAMVVRLASVGFLQGHMREMDGPMQMMARLANPSDMGAGMESLRQALVAAVDTAVLLALGIAVAASAGVSLYLSTRITRPLAEMADATRKIAGGDPLPVGREKPYLVLLERTAE